ncbi:MAG: spore maturation protein [Magnetococcales bacterium]|nr:spore maturation protein [Magnetococcales bacterium]
MNVLFFALVAVAFLGTAARELGVSSSVAGGGAPMQALTTAMVESANGAVTLAIGLVGVMAFFLGLMKVAEKGGLLVILARLIRPLMVRLFPDVPAEHPAMGAMVFNLAANLLGLGNAATPFGIRAMQELDRLNPHKGTATNAMVLFLAINTSSITLLPTTVIALRASAGSQDPAAILPTSLFASLFATLVAVGVAKYLQRHWPLPVVGGEGAVAGDAVTAEVAGPETTVEALSPGAGVGEETEFAGASAAGGYSPWVGVVTLVAFVGLVPLTIFYGKSFSSWVIPGLAVGLLGFGLLRGVRVYEAFVEGARDGFEVAVRIIPYLVAILVAVGMFRASGAMEVLVATLGPSTAVVGLPGEVLPLAVMRSLSGSGSYGLLAALLGNPATGPDTYAGLLASTIQCSSETTFYVLAVYFGAVQIRRMRHALVAGLIADLAGLVGSVVVCSWLVTP